MRPLHVRIRYREGMTFHCRSRTFYLIRLPPARCSHLDLNESKLNVTLCSAVHSPHWPHCKRSGAPVGGGAWSRLSSLKKVGLWRSVCAPGLHRRVTWGAFRTPVPRLYLGQFHHHLEGRDSAISTGSLHQGHWWDCESRACLRENLQFSQSSK